MTEQSCLRNERIKLMTVRSSYPSTFDIAVIGAGVVGCAVFREFVLAGARTIILERDPDFLNGASKGNSGLLHTGFDAQPGTLEDKCVRDGYRSYGQIHERLNLPLRKTGAIVIAWTEDEVAKLPAIIAQARANGVDVRSLSAAEVRGEAPDLNESAKAGVLVPGESVIDPWSTPLAYLLQGLANGGVVLCSAEVGAGRLADGAWSLDVTGRSVIKASVVINCAGNYGDLVEAIARPSPFHIRPRKGQFVVFDKTAFGLAPRILLPVPSARTKGVVVGQSAFGNLIVGPTAEDQDERRIATVEEATLAALIAEGSRIVPALAHHSVTAVYAGLRPATEFKDYQIEALPKERWITVGGIRSTGLTASLGIARHVRELYEDRFGALAGRDSIEWTPAPNLAEDRPRAYQQNGRSAIVCHCELVTEREIEAALEDPLPVATLGGLRRRTRCMMGRCQGFYCTRRISEIAAGRIRELPEPTANRRNNG
jgi:glycerol-3-phosphate dehydrogenase